MNKCAFYDCGLIAPVRSPNFGPKEFIDSGPAAALESVRLVGRFKGELNVRGVDCTLHSWLEWQWLVRCGGEPTAAISPRHADSQALTAAL